MIPHKFRNTSAGHFANLNRAGAVNYPATLQQIFSLDETRSAMQEISSWSGYRPTPLVNLANMAADSGLGAIYYKDESARFGLGSFKALGGAYAVLCLLQQKILEQSGKRVSGNELEQGGFGEFTGSITVVTATDGNHGRSVAWGAARFGCQCRIYIHAGVSENRAEAIRNLGAEVIRISGNYDESVHQAASDASANGWFVVSDTSYPGYTDLPAAVMAGYSVMMEEIIDQLPPEARLSHVFVQGGVGGLAASVAAYLWEKMGMDRPRLIVVEPLLADCLYQSAVNNRATEVHISTETIMAGLSCGEVSMLAWEVLSRAVDDFMSIDDELVGPCMRLLAHGQPGIEAGESAVAGLAGCMVACMNPDLKMKLELEPHSEVLVLGTEGATDRDIYNHILDQPD